MCLNRCLPVCDILWRDCGTFKRYSFGRRHTSLEAGFEVYSLVSACSVLLLPVCGWDLISHFLISPTCQAFSAIKDYSPWNHKPKTNSILPEVAFDHGMYYQQQKKGNMAEIYGFKKKLWIQMIFWLYPSHLQYWCCLCYSWSCKFSLFPESPCNPCVGLGPAVPCSVQLPPYPVICRAEALPEALPCCFCMVVKSSKVSVRTGGLQNAYVSMMASSPVLEWE